MAYRIGMADIANHYFLKMALVSPLLSSAAISKGSSKVTGAVLDVAFVNFGEKK